MSTRSSETALRLARSTVLAGFLAGQIVPFAWAGPSGGVVVGGQGTITQGGSLTQIHQQSNRLIIEWDSFDTTAQETVRFVQPNRDAMALNRVLSGQATRFNGSLFANGNVVIVNGAGIHFGPDSVIDVGGLIASTADIANTNFMAGRLVFDQPGLADAMVTNAGTITARDAGLAALVAPGVENSGLIRANLGTVVLAAGETHTVDFRGDGLISFAVTTPTTSTPRRADGSDAEALVENSGTVEADGGSVVMTASQASRVLDTAINMSGVAQANSVGVRNGRIVLGGGSSGRVRVAGTVRTQGTSTGTRGGTVHVTGEEIATESARIDASGVDGGGTVLIGGSERNQGLDASSDVAYVQAGDLLTILLGENAGAAGDGVIPLATRTSIDAETQIDASSGSGNGGDVVVWGRESVDFLGRITTLGGDNGFAEVSTYGTGFVGGKAVTGHMLIDPGDVCIFLSGTANCAAGATGVTFGTITDVLNFGGLFELNTDATGTSGTGRVDFGGGFPLTINNNSGTVGTFEIHAADTIDTNQVVIQNNGSSGTNFAWYAGSSETSSPVDSADIVLGPQVLGTGGGHGYFEAADDIRISDPVFTDGGDATFIARGGDAGSVIVIGAEGNRADDHIDTTDGAGNAGAITLQTDSLTINPNAATEPGLNAVIDAAGIGGVVTLRPTTAGRTIDLGTADASSLSITADDIDRIAAETLRIGDSTSGSVSITASISPSQVTNLSLITGGAIIDANATDPDIAVSGSALRAGAGIESLETAIDNLAFSNTAGVVSISNTGDLTVGEVDGLISSSNASNAATTVASTGTLSFLTDVTVGGALSANAATISLDGNLTAGAISGTAIQVNVIGSAGGAELQDAVDVAAVGAIVTVGDGTFAGGVTIDKALTMLGDGFTATTLVNVADGSTGMTVTSSNVTIDGFQFTGDGSPVDAIGVLIDGSGSALSNILIGDADADTFGSRFTGLTTGLLATDGGTSNVVAFEIGLGNVFDTSTNGIVMSGTDISLTGTTFNDTSFAGISGDFIRLENGAAFAPGNPTVLDATSVTFDGVLASSLTVARALAVEDKLVHYLDDPTLGLLNIGQLVVPDGNSIQLAVNAAGALGGVQTVTVGSGTFGGSVELWVDDLTLVGQGTTTIIDTDAVDPFANNDDVDNGFQIAAIDTSGVNPNDPSGAGDVDNVIISGFSFTTETTTGQNIGVELGETGVSTAIGATVQTSVFTDLLDGVLANAIDGMTTISGVTMTGIVGNGIRFDPALTATDTVLIEDSDITSVIDALRFASALSGTSVTISGSTLEGAGDGIEFTGTIGGGSQVTIAANTRIEGLGTFPDEDALGDAIAFRGAISGSTTSLLIDDNDLIRGLDRGINFASSGTGGPATITDAGVTISRNDEIIGTDIDGILFNAELSNAEILIGGLTTEDGNGRIVGGDDGIDVENVDDGSFTIANNTEIQGLTLNGIEFEGPVTNGGVVTVNDNGAIVGANTGIIFEGTVADSTVSISENTEIRGLSIDGIGFDSVVNSTVTIAGNTGVFGDGFDGVFIDGDLTDSALTIDENETIAGGENGISLSAGGVFPNNISGTTLSISDNLDVSGTIGDGIVLGDLVGGTDVTIEQNGDIRGGVDGIAIFGADSSTISIADNTRIVGEGFDGIFIFDELTDTALTITGNVEVNGVDDGLNVDAIDGSSVLITNNDQITGQTGSGLEFENFVTDVALFRIEDNSISAGEEGIEFDTPASITNSELNIARNIIDAGTDGLFFDGLITSSTIETSNNIIAADENGIRISQLGPDSLFSVDQSDVVGGVGGIAVTGASVGGTASLVLGDSTFSGMTGAGISVTTLAAGTGVTTEFTAPVTTTGRPSLAMSGPNQAIVGNDIGNVTFNSVAGGNFIELSNGALFEPDLPTVISGIGATFDGGVVTTNTALEIIRALERRIIDFDDNPTLGQIFLPLGEPLPFLFDVAFETRGVRTTNIQTPGDWILRPDFSFQILATNPLLDDYPLATCLMVSDERTDTFTPRCINPAGLPDPSPEILRYLETVDQFSMAQ